MTARADERASPCRACRWPWRRRAGAARDAAGGAGALPRDRRARRRASPARRQGRGAARRVQRGVCRSRQVSPMAPSRSPTIAWMAPVVARTAARPTAARVTSRRGLPPRSARGSPSRVVDEPLASSRCERGVDVRAPHRSAGALLDVARQSTRCRPRPGRAAARPAGRGARTRPKVRSRPFKSQCDYLTRGAVSGFTGNPQLKDGAPRITAGPDSHFAGCSGMATLRRSPCTAMTDSERRRLDWRSRSPSVSGHCRRPRSSFRPSSLAPGS